MTNILSQKILMLFNKLFTSCSWGGSAGSWTFLAHWDLGGRLLPQNIKYYVTFQDSKLKAVLLIKKNLRFLSGRSRMEWLLVKNHLYFIILLYPKFISPDSHLNHEGNENIGLALVYSYIVMFIQLFLSYSHIHSLIHLECLMSVLPRKCPV